MYNSKESTFKYSYYIKFFHEHFNLHFVRPQIDTCCQCENLTIKIKIRRSTGAEIMIYKRAEKWYTALQDTSKEIQKRRYCCNCHWLNPEFAVTGDFCSRTFLFESTEC